MVKNNIYDEGSVKKVGKIWKPIFPFITHKLCVCDETSLGLFQKM